MSLEEKIKDILQSTNENGVMDFLYGQSYEWALLINKGVPIEVFSLIGEISWLEDKLLDAYERLSEVSQRVNNV